eukprot:3562710-Pyramimonas_sp.AAC.2
MYVRVRPARAQARVALLTMRSPRLPRRLSRLRELSPMLLQPKTITPEGDLASPKAEAERGRAVRRPLRGGEGRERSREIGVNPIDRVEKRASYHVALTRETPRTVAGQRTAAIKSIED